MNAGSRWLLGIVALVSGVLVSGCSTTPHHSAAHWSYEGDTGPEHWGSLDPAYHLCATGTRQSPINLDPSATTNLPDIVFAYAPSPWVLTNNGHTIQATPAPGSAILLDGERFELVQFHLHAPSEHTVVGLPAAAEMHFVHRSPDGRLAVLGVLLVATDTPHPDYAAFSDNVPAKPGASTTLDAPRSPENLLPSDRRTIRYDGSLTTPPGTEGVRWNVFPTRVGISAEQLAAFTAIIPPNNRPVQPRNDREILLDAAIDAPAAAP